MMMMMNDDDDLSSRHHQSCDDCLEDKSEDYQNCSVLYQYCIPQLC